MPIDLPPELVGVFAWFISSLGDHALSSSLTHEPAPIARAIHRAVETWRAQGERPSIPDLTLERTLRPSAESTTAAHVELRDVLARGELPDQRVWRSLLDEGMTALREQRGADPERSFLDDQELDEHLDELAAAIVAAILQEPALVLPYIAGQVRPARPRAAATQSALVLRDQLETSERHQDLAGRAVRYVPREAAEQAIRDAAQGTTWALVVGAAGTGKSTLLHRLHRMWLDEALAGAPLIPILVDAQQLTGEASGSGLGSLMHDLGIDSSAAVDALDDLQRRLREDARQLLVLIDTLDAALLSDGQAQRLVRWIDTEAARLGIRIVTTCRPIEASRLRRRTAREIQLDDYTVDEARRAIDHYLDAYHANLPASARAAFADRLHTMLASPMTSSLCRRPVTLRMIFEAYAADNIPEKLNRARLFGDFWAHRVARDPIEQGVVRPRRSDAGQRELLALLLADATRRSAGRTFLPDSHAHALAAGNLDALDDLLSERVLVAEQRRVEFFHQLFLEHAAARALIAAFIRGDVSGLDAELAMSPSWHALLEEVVVLGAGHPSPNPAEIVLSTLMNRGTNDAFTSVATAWVQLEDVHGFGTIADEITRNALMRSTCLDQIHNASRVRLTAIMETIGTAAWRSGDPSERRSVLRALVKLIPVASDLVRTFIGAELATDAQLSAILDPSQGGALAEPLVELFAGFLGEDDAYAGELLQRFASLVEARPQSRMMTALVEATAARASFSPTAVSLVWDWFQREDRARYDVIRRSKAFAEAVVTWSAPASAQTWLDRPGAVRDRWVSVLRLRLERGLEALDVAIGPCFESAEETGLIVQMHEAIFAGPIGAGEADVQRMLLRIVGRPALTPPDRVRRKMALRALRARLPDPDLEQVIVTTFGEALIEGHEPDETMLALAISNRLSATLLRRLQVRCGIDSNVATAVARAWPSMSPNWPGDIVVLPWLPEPPTHAHAVALASAAPALARTISDATRRALRTSLETWFAAERAPRERRLESLRGIVGMATSDEPLTSDVVAHAFAAWRLAGDGGLGGQLGSCLATAIAQGAIADDARAQALDGAATILHASSVTNSSVQSIESRRGALAIVVAAHTAEPGTLASELERLLDRAEAGDVTTEELGELATASYHVARVSPRRAWRIAERIAQRSKPAMEKNWNNVAPRLRGTIGAALDDPAVRAEVVASLPTLGNYMQGEVIRVAMHRHDEDFADAVAPLEVTLGRRAVTLLTWWRRRLPPPTTDED